RQLRIGPEQLLGCVARLLHHLAIPKLRHLQVWQTALARSEEFAGSPKVKIRLGQRKPVARLLHQRETPVAQLARRIGDEQARRLSFAPPDASSKLVELRQAKAIRAFHEHDRRVWDVNP